MTDNKSIACCHECKRPLTVIDYYSEYLTGCTRCNLLGPARERQATFRASFSYEPSY
jgi:hypothetical protein